MRTHERLALDSLSASIAFLAGLGGAGWMLPGRRGHSLRVLGRHRICVGCLIYARIWGCEQCELPARG